MLRGVMRIGVAEVTESGSMCRVCHRDGEVPSVTLLTGEYSRAGLRDRKHKSGAAQLVVMLSAEVIGGKQIPGDDIRRAVCYWLVLGCGCIGDGAATDHIAINPRTIGPLPSWDELTAMRVSNFGM